MHGEPSVISWSLRARRGEHGFNKIFSKYGVFVRSLIRTTQKWEGGPERIIGGKDFFCIYN